jgi:hypothetical protein
MPRLRSPSLTLIVSDEHAVRPVLEGLFVAVDLTALGRTDARFPTSLPNTAASPLVNSIPSSSSPSSPPVNTPVTTPSGEPQAQDIEDLHDEYLSGTARPYVAPDLSFSYTPAHVNYPLLAPPPPPPAQRTGDVATQDIPPPPPLPSPPPQANLIVNENGRFLTRFQRNIRRRQAGFLASEALQSTTRHRGPSPSLWDSSSEDSQETVPTP